MDYDEMCTILQYIGFILDWVLCTKLQKDPIFRKSQISSIPGVPGYSWFLEPRLEGIAFAPSYIGTAPENDNRTGHTKECQTCYNSRNVLP
ncbi:hypothetical protein XENTR_v10021663 [Xenopus tropicalis]|nr:hypothetical protein XENTR_v10021663 [Xenopus tropicalis]